MFQQPLVIRFNRQPTVNSSPWWCNQMETCSALLAFCAGYLPVTGDFPAQRPVTWSFDVLFDLRLNKQLSKQTGGWWFETQSRSLWRHCQAVQKSPTLQTNSPCLCKRKVGSQKSVSGSLLHNNFFKTWRAFPCPGHPRKGPWDYMSTKPDIITLVCGIHNF